MDVEARNSTWAVLLVLAAFLVATFVVVAWADARHQDRLVRCLEIPNPGIAAHCVRRLEEG